MKDGKGENIKWNINDLSSSRYCRILLFVKQHLRPSLGNAQEAWQEVMRQKSDNGSYRAVSCSWVMLGETKGNNDASHLIRIKIYVII